MFQNDQKKLYQELDGITRESDIRPNPQKSCTFLSNIWDNPIEHNREAESLDDVREKFGQHAAQENVTICVTDVKQQLKKVANWKGPGQDGVQGYWLKYFTTLHWRIYRTS